MKIGCVDVGGGLRDIYGAGVFDRLLDEGISLDYCIGVSAGSANCASFVAKQRGRNKKFYLDYLSRKQAIGIKNFIKTGSVLNLEYIYGTLCASNGENPLDYKAIIESETAFTVVATNAKTGKPVYFDKHNDMSFNDYRILMASSCLPVFCKPIRIKENLYYDGGLSDPVPFEKAFEYGCDKVIIILTKPINEKLNQNRNDLGAFTLRRKFPEFSNSMKSSASVYDRQVKSALELQKQGRALVLAPDSIDGLGTLSRDINKLTSLYNKGYKDAEKVKLFLK